MSDAPKTNNRLDSLSMSRLTVWAADHLSALQKDGKTQIECAALATSALGFPITGANVKRVSIHLKLKWPRNGNRPSAKAVKPPISDNIGVELAVDSMHDTLKLVLARLDSIAASLGVVIKENPNAPV